MINKNVKKNSELWVIMKIQMKSETETIVRIYQIDTN